MAWHWTWLIKKSTKTDLHLLTWKQCPEQVVKWKELLIKQYTWWDATFFFLNKKPSVLLYLHIQPGNLQSPTFRLIDSSLIPNTPAKPISPSLLGSSYSSFKMVPITTSRTFFVCPGALCSPRWQLPLGWEFSHLIFCLAQSWGHGWIQFGGIRAWPLLHALYVFVGYMIE